MVLINVRTTRRRISEPSSPAGQAVLGMLAAATLLLATAGCHPSTVAERRIQVRADRRAAVIGTCRESEARRLPNLEKAGVYIDENERHHGRAFELSWADFGERLRNNRQHWQDRQPVYQSEIFRILRGRATPERLEDTVVTLFF